MPKFRYIIDKDTGMLSLYDFSNALPLNEAQIIFRKSMSNRFKMMDRILKRAKTICIVTARKIDIEEIKAFIDKFTQLYQFEKLYYINAYPCDEEKLIRTEIDNKTEIQEFYYKGKCKNNLGVQQNPKSWLISVKCWDKIMSDISLNGKFIRKNKESKLFKVNYLLSDEYVQKIIYVFGIKIKFRIK